MFTVSLQVLGEPETGVWCDRCMLPSAVRIRYVMSNPNLRSTIGTGAWVCCPDCED